MADVENGVGLWKGGATYDTENWVDLVLDRDEQILRGNRYKYMWHPIPMRHLLDLIRVPRSTF